MSTSGQTWSALTDFLLALIHEKWSKPLKWVSNCSKKSHAAVTQRYWLLIFAHQHINILQSFSLLSFLFSSCLKATILGVYNFILSGMTHDSYKIEMIRKQRSKLFNCLIISRERWPAGQLASVKVPVCYSYGQRITAQRCTCQLLDTKYLIGVKVKKTKTKTKKPNNNNNQKYQWIVKNDKSSVCLLSAKKWNK